MKIRNITLLVFLASLITIVTSILHITKGIFIPALGPFALGFMVLGLAYIARENYKSGKASKKYYKFMLITGLIGGITNIYVGVLQLLSYIK